MRPLARGGAFVAGADDIGAMWYNPAGLADAQGTFMVDASMMLFTASYTQSYQATAAAGNIVTCNLCGPTVNGDVPPIAIPTIGIAFPVGAEKRLTLGGGAYAPYAPLSRFPETVTDSNGNTVPSPSRYSLVSLEGSALAIVELFAAYKITDELHIGAGLQLLTGVFQSVNDLDANPGILGAQQDPQYDTLTQTRATIFTPSANLGVTWIPSKYVRVGLAGQLPFWIDAPASVTVRLPNAVEFDNASQVGDSAGVKFRLPAHIRAGVEVRPTENLRAEISYEHQFWSLHDTIDITPHGIQLNGVTGFPTPYAIPPISIQRHFQDSDGVHLGAEYRIDASPTFKVHLRAGFGYESSAVPRAYESPLTIDGDKFTFAGGLGVTIDRTRIDATFAYVMMSDVNVAASEAALYPINPVQGNPAAPGTVSAMNGGRYTASAPIIGLGLQYAFDVSPVKKAAPPPPPPPVVVVAPPPPPPAPPPVTVAAEKPVEETPTKTKPKTKPKPKKTQPQP